MSNTRLVERKRTSPQVAENRPEETSVEEGAKSKRGRPFQPGNQFGRGRPRGSPNKKSLLVREILLENGPEIMLKVVELAKKGDRTAMTLCVERLIARLKDLEEPVKHEPIKVEIEWV
jgi:hypothetical protein